MADNSDVNEVEELSIKRAVSLRGAAFFLEAGFNSGAGAINPVLIYMLLKKSESMPCCGGVGDLNVCGSFGSGKGEGVSS